MKVSPGYANCPLRQRRRGCGVVCDLNYTLAPFLSDEARRGSGQVLLAKSASSFKQEGSFKQQNHNFVEIEALVVRKSTF